MSRRPLAGRPPDDVRVPAAVTALAGGAAPEPVWRNELGGLTFRLGDRFVKWAPRGTVDLADETVRLVWAARYAEVPEVLDHGTEHDGGGWLVTRALPGRSAVDPSWLGRPAQAAHALGPARRRLHDALPVADCPFSWSVTDRLRRKVGDIGPAPDVDVLVVCHGDACAPNTLLHDDGSLAGHVDLGSLGVADRWADLAVAAWSTVWNHGPGHEAGVYAGYGVDPDPVRIAFYRRLWDLPDTPSAEAAGRASCT